jgi:ketosteroid isomerase-like protein
MMRDLYDALGRGDIPALLGAMDPGIEWREAEGKIRDGKITSCQQYADTAQLQDVEGAR